MSKKEKYKLEEVLALNNREKFLKTKKKFYYYTSRKTLEDILSKKDRGERFLYIRSIEKMNDSGEASLHQEDGKKVFCFCMCFTEVESIPLWYLYGGVRGNGVRIGITPGKMKALVRNIKEVYPVVDKKPNYDKSLVVGKDFQLEVGWVFYCDYKNNKINYRGKLYKVEKLEKNNLSRRNYFVKDYPWNYEREFRLVFKFEKEVQAEFIAIPLPQKLIDELEIMSAPECEFSEEEKSAYNSSGVKWEKMKKSNLNIKMDLLKRNKKSIIDEIEEWCGEEEMPQMCQHIKQKDGCNPHNTKITWNMNVKEKVE